MGYSYRFDTTDAQTERPYNGLLVSIDTTDAQTERPYNGLHVSI